MTPDELRGGGVAEAIRRHRLIAVLRRVEPREALLALVDQLADAGAAVFEITFDGPDGGGDLAAVRARLGQRQGPGCLVGAGTILTATHLEAATAAGADFAVSPVLDLGLMRSALGHGLPFVPGGLTPTEIASAWEAGATFVKVFPASAVGPAFVRELRGPLPHIQVIPTGGVDASTARAYLDAGAAAVGVGGAITRADDAARRDLVRAIAG